MNLKNVAPSERATESRGLATKILKALKISLMTIILLPFALIALYIVAYNLMGLFVQPSNSRDWNTDQQVLPSAEINSDTITIHNIRNFSYTSTSEFTPAYYDKTYNLKDLAKVYYIVEPFSGFKGSAHTFLSFEFQSSATTSNTATSSNKTISVPNREFISVSVEIRKEKGESFSALKGLFKQYEITYVLADERDVVKLRSNFRKDQVYVYPLNTSSEKGQALFLDILGRVNKLQQKPEFYNTAFNTCTTNIMRHANRITPQRIPWSYKVLLPGYSDELAYDIGILDTDLSLEEARKKFNINERAIQYSDSEDFSIKIRE